MNFLKKLFCNNKPTEDEQKKDPENTKLNYLLDIWGENPSNENYEEVMNEILNGDCFLLLPSVNESESGVWKTAEENTMLNLTSVFNLDGLKVLGAFSNEKALVEWAKQPTQYTAIPTATVIEMCREQAIDRIVINSDQKNMFVLERNRENIASRAIEKDTEVMVGKPSKPLQPHILEKLVSNFRQVQTIDEAYQYVQVMNEETSLVLGIKMSVVSDNSRAALYNALNNSLNNEKLELPLDIMVLETQDWLNTVRGIENSLFYKR